MATSITPQIVTLNVGVQAPPEPNNLQHVGAIVSTGGTILAMNTMQYCPNAASVAAILQPTVTNTGIGYTSGTATVTVPAMTAPVGTQFFVTIAGASPSVYNGNFLATVTTATTFTYALANGGTPTVMGTSTAVGAGFVQAASTAFFAQGTSQGVYVLELGAQAGDPVSALTTYMTNRQSATQTIYAYLLDPVWDAQYSSDIATLAKSWASDTAKTYFFVSTNLTNASAYTNIKSVFAVAQAAGLEVTAAGAFYQWIGNNPGPGNILAPMFARFMFGLNNWPDSTGVKRTQLLMDNCNYIDTGAQGGISDSILYPGILGTGVQASFWYGVDWVQINAQQQLAAAIINGSNVQPPLLYDQNGINTLQAVAQSVLNSAVQYGCAESATVTAVPFAAYIAANPTDYANGVYNGLTATMTGQFGFINITFNLSAVQFGA